MSIGPIEPISSGSLQYYGVYCELYLSEEALEASCNVPEKYLLCIFHAYGYPDVWKQLQLDVLPNSRNTNLFDITDTITLAFDDPTTAGLLEMMFTNV
jgi:hypothetical protein